MRKQRSETRRLGSPPGEESPALAANRAFRKSKRSAGPYSAAELPANGNNLEPGTAIVSDPQIEGYFPFLGPELLFSDNPADRRRYLSIHQAYSIFRRSGSQENRFEAWKAITKACRWAPKKPHPIYQPTSSDAPIGQPGSRIRTQEQNERQASRTVYRFRCDKSASSVSRILPGAWY